MPTRRSSEPSRSTTSLPSTKADSRPGRSRRASGRTIKTIAEIQEFSAAAVAATHADPSTIRLHVPQDMRVAEIVRSDGRKVYDVLVDTW